MNKDGDRLHFTFFVSGINYIADASRNIYEGPHQRRGASRINFGGSPEDVRRRVDYVNELYRAGHEIASHAIGHFDGRSWSAADWEKEFRAYERSRQECRRQQRAFRTRSSPSRPREVIGFRAPYLAKGAGPLSRRSDERLPL